MKRLLASDDRMGGGALRAAASKAFAAAAVTLLCAFALAGCASDEPAGAVAATVNGASIYEDDVTSYVEDFRAANEGYEEDEAWAAYLSDLGLDGESLRAYVINYYAETIAIVQDAERLGIKAPSEADIDERLELVKAEYDEMAEYYAGVYGVNDWETYFRQIYVNEENFRRASAADLVKEDHRAAVLGDVTVGDEDYIEFLSEYGHYYASKHVSRAVFASQEDADSAIARLRDGSASWGEILGECSSDEELAASSGDLGWDIFTNSLTYAESVALWSLGKGECSDAIETDKGAFAVVFCVDEFEVPAEIGSLTVEDIPLEIKEYLEKRFFDNAYDAYLDGLYASMDLAVNPMPDGLSYCVKGADGLEGEEAEGE